MLFRSNEEVCVVNKKTGQNELFIIPLDQRIYVMEDVDAISEILYSREIQDKLKKEQEEREQIEQQKINAQYQKSGLGIQPPPKPQTPENKE